MTRTIDSSLLTEQKKMAYKPSIALTFADNNLPHANVRSVSLSDYSGNPTASVTTTNAIVRAHRVAGTGVSVQRITDPSLTANWETGWTLIVADAYYPALFWTGSRVVLVYQDSTYTVKWRTSDDEGVSWSSSQTLWTPGYWLNNVQFGVCGSTNRAGLLYADGATLYFRRYSDDSDTWYSPQSTTYAGNVSSAAGTHISGYSYTFAVIVDDYADWTDSAIVLQPYTYSPSVVWGTPVVYMGIQGGTGASPAYQFTNVWLGKLPPLAGGEGGDWYWMTFSYTAATIAGALYDNTDSMIALSDDGSYFTGGLRTEYAPADRLQGHRWGTITYLCSDTHLLRSTPVSSVSVATERVMALDLRDEGPTAYAEVKLDNRDGTYDTLPTGRLGCDLTIEHGAYVSSTAYRVTRELFAVSRFTREDDGESVTIRAYNYYRLLSLWRAELSYYYASLTLQSLVESICALAGVHACTFDDNDIWDLTVDEFVIQPGETADDVLSTLQDQFQFVSRMTTTYTAQHLVLSASPSADYTFGTGSGEHQTLRLEDTADRSAPDITHAEVIGDGAGAQDVATAIHREMGRQFTYRIVREQLTTDADCATIAEAITTKVTNSIARAQLVGLPAFHLQPFDAVSSDDWSSNVVRYITTMRMTYNPTRQYQSRNRQGAAIHPQVWRQSLTLATLVPTASGAEGVSTLIPEAMKGTDIRKGKIISFDTTTWKALVRFEDTAAAVQIRAGHWLSPAIMTAGSSVAVLLFDRTNPADGLVIGTYGGSVTWSQFDRLYSSDGSPTALTADAAGNLTPGGDINLGETFNLTGGTATIADDGVYSFTPNQDQGVILVYSRHTTLKTAYAILNYRAIATVYAQLIVTGTNVEATTGALTGTTGTDGKLTISAHSDGKVYIENRLGSSYQAGWVLFGL